MGNKFLPYARGLIYQMALVGPPETRRCRIRPIDERSDFFSSDFVSSQNKERCFYILIALENPFAPFVRRGNGTSDRKVSGMKFSFAQAQGCNCGLKGLGCKGIRP